MDVGDAHRYLAHPLQHGQGIRAGAGLHRRQSLRLDDAGEDLAHLRIVVHDEASRGGAVLERGSHGAKLSGASREPVNLVEYVPLGPPELRFTIHSL